MHLIIIIRYGSTPYFFQNYGVENAARYDLVQFRLEFLI